MDQITARAINTLRFLSADAVQQANSGHPGLPMGAAAMAFVVWTRHMHHNPRNPKWAGRDRFILSGGHGSMLLYSLLHLTGYDLPINAIFGNGGARPQGIRSTVSLPASKPPQDHSARDLPRAWAWQLPRLTWAPNSILSSSITTYSQL
jgi:hypothetical protein